MQSTKVLLHCLPFGNHYHWLITIDSSCSLHLWISFFQTAVSFNLLYMSGGVVTHGHEVIQTLIHKARGCCRVQCWPEPEAEPEAEGSARSLLWAVIITYSLVRLVRLSNLINLTPSHMNDMYSILIIWKVPINITYCDVARSRILSAHDNNTGKCLIWR